MTRERLIRLFMSGARPPYLLRYEYRKVCSGYREDLPMLRELMKEGLVRQVSKDATCITYQYIPPPVQETVCSPQTAQPCPIKL